MRILVVEDERLLCDGIAEDLELEKYTVERCYDGADAYNAKTGYDIPIHVDAATYHSPSYPKRETGGRP